jgi:hypothetical protein
VSGTGIPRTLELRVAVANDGVRRMQDDKGDGQSLCKVLCMTERRRDAAV